MSSHVGKSLEAYFDPPEEKPARRITITVWGEVYEAVQEVAQSLSLSWAKTANILLQGAARDGMEWIQHTGFVSHYQGLSPELMQALEDGPTNPLFDEAQERSGLKQYRQVRQALQEGPSNSFYEQAVAIREKSKERRAETMRKALEAGPGDPLYEQAKREAETGIVPELY